MSATPRPWRLIEGRVYGPEGYDYGVYSSGPIANVNACIGTSVEPGKTYDRDFPESEANAALIVRAVNNFDSLLEAARAAEQELLVLHASFESDGFVSRRAMCGECEASWEGTATWHSRDCRANVLLVRAESLRDAIAAAEATE